MSWGPNGLQQIKCYSCKFSQSAGKPNKEDVTRGSSLAWYLYAYIWAQGVTTRVVRYTLDNHSSKGCQMPWCYGVKSIVQTLDKKVLHICRQC